MPKPAFLLEGGEGYDKDKILSYGPYVLYDRKDVFTEASLVLGQKALSREIEWILWVSIPVDTFTSAFGDSLPKGSVTLRGKVSGPILFYENLNGFEVDVCFHFEGSRPRISILKGTDELYDDFCEGVAMEKYLDWQERMNA